MNNDDRFKSFQNKYPNLFKEYPRSGFYLPNGWDHLVHNLCSLVEDHITRLPEEIREHVQCAQVKEKFGTLRFYMEQDTPYIRGVIELAELMSYDICETCGKPGKIRKGGWVQVLCNKHYKEKQKLAKAIIEGMAKKLAAEKKK